MEKKERLKLLLAYGFTSLLFGFMIVLILTFINFPFHPGSPLAFVMTIAVFVLAFYCAARLVSKYLDFRSSDAKFILKLTLGVGLFMIIVDIVVDGTKMFTLFSNISFLVAFLVCTELFLKPRTEMVGIKDAFMQSHTYKVIVSIGKFAIAASRGAALRWRAIRSRYQTATESVS